MRQGEPASSPDFPAHYNLSHKWPVQLLVKWRVGVEKLGSKTRFPSGEFLPVRVFLLVVVAYALAIAGCALRLRNRTSRFRFCATADRKSTRLNSSHSQISYAVFCL